MDVFYILNKDTGKAIVYNGLPWATPHEELAWFVWGEMSADQKRNLEVKRFSGRGPHAPFEVVYQRKAEWVDKKLGYADSAPESTIGNYGCVVCGIAMMGQLVLNRFVSPVEVNKRLVDARGFSGRTRNLVLWEKVTEAFPELKLDWDYPSEKRAAPVERMSVHLDNGGFLICKVDFRPVDRFVQSHYLLVTEIADDLSTGSAADPWTGQMVNIPPAYFNAGWRPVNLGRAIMRTVAFSRA